MIFDDLTDRVYSNPDFTEPATWYQGGAGPGLSVLFIRSVADQTTDIFGEDFVTGGIVIRVPVKAIPDLRPADQFDFDGRRHVVKGEPRKDPRGRVWIIELGG
tara:strand:- start:3868 stop:4176 length:309 start_codon:yes stop_codon:yes gene_type:complete